MPPSLETYSAAAEQPRRRPSRSLRRIEQLREFLSEEGGTLQHLARKHYGHLLTDWEIEDAVGDAIVCAWRSGLNYRPKKGDPLVWIWAITRNCATKILQNRSKYITLLVEEADLDLPEPLPQVLSSQQRRLIRDVRECIDALPALQRAVMRADLRSGDVCPVAELAQELQCAKGSIFVARCKGRKALVAALAELGHDLSDQRFNAPACP